MEGGRVTGLRGIGAAHRPSPDQPVRCGGELGALHDLPELQILTNLVEAEGALDVVGGGTRGEGGSRGGSRPGGGGEEEGWDNSPRF